MKVSLFGSGFRKRTTTGIFLPCKKVISSFCVDVMSNLDKKLLLQFLAGVNDECAGGILHFKVALPFLPCHAIIFNGNNNSLKPGRHFFCFIYRSLEQSACCINAC